MIAKLWQFIIKKNKCFPSPCLTLLSIFMSYFPVFSLILLLSRVVWSIICLLLSHCLYYSPLRPTASLALLMSILLAMFRLLPLLYILNSSRWYWIFSLSLQQQKLWFNGAMMSTVLYCAPLHALVIVILFLFWNEALKYAGTQERVSTLFSVNKNILSNLVITFQMSCLFSCSLEELILLIVPAYNL